MKLQCVKIEKGQSFEIEAGWRVYESFPVSDGILVMLQFCDYESLAAKLPTGFPDAPEIATATQDTTPAQ